MSDEKAVPFNSSAALIEEAKKERQRLVEQIEQSQRTIEHSRQVIARIDEGARCGSKEIAALSYRGRHKIDRVS
jgi:hypothetical protein